MDMTGGDTTGEQMSADVAVVGGGFSGLVAAIGLAEAGLEVVAIDKSPQLGGAARFAAGLIWTYPDVDRYLAEVPGADPELARIVADGLDPAVEWLAAHGVTISDRMEGVLGSGVGYRLLDPMDTVISSMAAALTAAGGQILTGSAAASIRSDTRRRVAGVWLDPTAPLSAISARAVVLSTGGFQGNVELLSRFVTPDADHLVLRADPASTGDGFQFALDVGALASRGLQHFYGHLMPAPPAVIRPEQFRTLSQYFSVHGLVVDRAGCRFVDEAAADELTAQALSRRPGASGYLILDRVGVERAREPHSPGAPPADRLGAVEKAGGSVIDCADLAAVGEAIRVHGGDGRRALEDVEEHNSRVTSSPERLVPNSSKDRAVDEPPFVCIPVVAGITYTHGGIRVDDSCRVIGRSYRPIEGLYASGADVGATSYERYAGGFAAALTLGRRVVEAVTADLGVAS